jgi:hypothetical protein
MAELGKFKTDELTNMTRLPLKKGLSSFGTTTEKMPTAEEKSSGTSSQGASVMSTTAKEAGPDQKAPAIQQKMADANKPAASASTDVTKTNRDLNMLDPEMKRRIEATIADAKAQGIDLRPIETFRSQERQNYLYAQGRTRPGNIVTNAKHSNHTRYDANGNPAGVAVDVVPFVNGKPDWNSKQWKQIGEIGKKNGLVWGGDFKKLNDSPHFELPKPAKR